MEWLFTPYAIALFVSGILSAGLAGLVWRWRAARAGLPLALLMAAVAEWTLASAFEAAVVGVPGKILWSKISYVGSTSSPIFFFWFALEYMHLEKWLSPRNLVLASLIPAASFTLAITNEWHQLIWTSFTPIHDGRNIVIYGHGAWFWVMVAYIYLLVGTGILLLIRSAFKFRHVHRHQAVLLFLGGMVPWLGNMLYVFEKGPFPGQDLTPIAFGITGLLLTLNLYQFQFLDIVPVARDRLVENMPDGVLVLDDRNRVVDANPALQRLTGVGALRAGDDMCTALAAWPALAEACLSPTEAHFEVKLSGDAPRYLGVRVSNLRDRRKRVTGRLIVLRDITTRKQAEEDRERLVGELQAALASVKTLRGLLPICANCKKIRDDEGYWRGVEEYVMDHSDAQFSHGICPDCVTLLYPWFKPNKE